MATYLSWNDGVVVTTLPLQDNMMGATTHPLWGDNMMGATTHPQWGDNMMGATTHPQWGDNILEQEVARTMDRPRGARGVHFLDSAISSSASAYNT
jgi:hypothetical protein